MKLRLILPLAFAAIVGTADVAAQSAIYACGHISRSRPTAIEKLKASGYTTAILFNVNVEPDGSLTTDFDWNNQRPAEAGGIICRNGEYIFDQYQPEYINDIKSLLEQPTSINRIEICIGGWGNGSYGHIKNIVEQQGTGPETVLYKNFVALKQAIPEIVAVNNDQEQDYDVASATAFHRMLAEIGFKTTIAPYTYKDYWRQLVANLNAKPGTVDLVYLQTYGGGAGNNPSDWKVFGDVPMWVGFDCEASSDISAMEQRFSGWKSSSGAVGGFLWNYNSESRNLNQWATTINRIFPPKVADAPVATFYSELDFGGYGISLPVGTFPQSELALYGIAAQDIASYKVSDGYKVTAYLAANCEGSNQLWTGELASIPRGWRNGVKSLVIEADEEEGLDSIVADSADTAELYNAAGVKIAELSAPFSIPDLPSGLYILRIGSKSYKFLK